jgi:hypothetical protein
MSNFYIENNHGDCIQNFHETPPPRPPRSLLDKFGLGSATLVALCIVTMAVLWLVSQWLPVVSDSMTLLVAKQHAKATIPFCWLVISLAGGYYYFSRKLFS